MNKLIKVSAVAAGIGVMSGLAGCGKGEAESAPATFTKTLASDKAESAARSCVLNMTQIRAACEQWGMMNGGTPKFSDLCGADKYMRSQPTCPAGGVYAIVNESGGFTVTCSSGAAEHVLGK